MHSQACRDSCKETEADIYADIIRHNQRYSCWEIERRKDAPTEPEMQPDRHNQIDINNYGQGRGTNTDRCTDVFQDTARYADTIVGR